MKWKSIMKLLWTFLYTSPNPSRKIVTNIGNLFIYLFFSKAAKPWSQRILILWPYFGLDACLKPHNAGLFNSVGLWSVLMMLKFFIKSFSDLTLHIKCRVEHGWTIWFLGNPKNKLGFSSSKSVLSFALLHYNTRPGWCKWIASKAIFLNNTQDRYLK